MKLVNREGFILHTEGTLLYRDGSGKCQIGDGLEFEEAVKILEKGGEIGLISDGEQVSTIKSINGVYVEIACEN